MATAHLRGTARLEYTPPGGSLVTHLLATPLRDLTPTDMRSRYEWWSEDQTTREVVTIGAGVRDLQATIRFENQPAALKTLLRHALEDDVTVTYRLAAGGTAYPVKIVSVGGDGGIEIQPDRQRSIFGEYEVRIRMRRVDGGTFDALLSGGAG